MGHQLFDRTKDEYLRLCDNNQMLNKNMIRDLHPLPHINELLNRLQGAQYFPKLDLHVGYFHVLIAD